ncbi:hypothetical protein [Escherichia coli]|uniref:hypothetical protein n=1 Tax=Escherichia coli TaxID=562 RepID=UPI0039A64084
MMGLLMNISSVIPALFFKIDKKVKISIMIRLYLLSIFLIFTLTILSTNIIDKYSIFPVWLPIVSTIFFMIALTNILNIAVNLYQNGKGE